MTSRGNKYCKVPGKLQERQEGGQCGWKTEDEQEDTEVKEVPRSQLNQRLVGTLALPPSETHGWIFEHDQIYNFTGLSQMLCSQ